ncbi:MAG: hypothetical protein HWQ38_08090 [Nostoc sp. NMS7]|uniref:hypothetical protein n=1 Tax=Nostoc sp. NMS7 TaxID=2815391 RepID=UPI0025EEE5A4|nr:hypothetical protein [Nostoc sp. NMS7]MBN3946442.1 hypothetical protein [Nostoc sp. NMS7]
MTVKKPDCTGQRFGLLTVLGIAEKRSKDNRQLWRLQCDCGKIIERPRSNFATHKNLSCGCQKRLRQIQRNQQRAKPDCTGQRFGMLLVLGLGSSHPKHGRLWKVLCDCGNIVESTRTNLDSGRQISCGCRGKQILVDSRRPIDIKRVRFGDLVAIALTGKKDLYNQPTWKLQCDCGNTCKISLKILNSKCKYNSNVNCGNRADHPENHCSYPPNPLPYPPEAGELLIKYLPLTELNYPLIDTAVEDEKRDRLLRAAWILAYRRSQGEEISELHEKRYIYKSLRYCSIDVFWRRKLEQHGGFLYDVNGIKRQIGSTMTDLTSNNYPVIEAQGIINVPNNPVSKHLRFRRC